MQPSRTVTLVFDNENDAALFRNWVAKCKEKDGTVIGVQAGISCSTVKRAEIINGPVLCFSEKPGEPLQPSTDYCFCYFRNGNMIVAQKGEETGRECWAPTTFRPSGYALHYDGIWYSFICSAS